VSRALALAGFLAILGAGAGAFMTEWLVAWMLYHPEPGISAGFAPRDAPVPVEEVFLETQDDVRLHSFYVPAPGATRALLYLHGNAGNASHRLPLAVLLARTGTNVWLLDYRGYGRSEGSPSEAGLYEDARAALAHLVDARGFDPRRVVLFGSSLGGAVALHVAQDRELGGVILESTFDRLAAVAAAHFGPLAGWVVGGRYDSLAKIARLRAPLLFLHGDRDEVVPFALGRRLFDAAPGPKGFATLRGAGHNDIPQVAGAHWLEQIRRFLDQVAPPGATSSR
jgi:pimeloyl-ACP methyl ester carboxylesterase